MHITYFIEICIAKKNAQRPPVRETFISTLNAVIFVLLLLLCTKANLKFNLVVSLVLLVTVKRGPPIYLCNLFVSKATLVKV